MYKKVALLLLAICVPILSHAWVRVTISSPSNNATVTSPVLVSASATSNHSITGWHIYVDGTSVYQAGATKTISTNVSMVPGTHKVVVRAWASNGSYGSGTSTITVKSTSGTA